MTNIHVARSILECCDGELRKVAMLQVDLEKAFDRVSHDVLRQILKHIEIGPIIFEGVQMAYYNCTTSLIVNKRVSERIPVKSSVRQGCPLSPLLFALYIEPYCLSIIQSEHVRGFTLNAREVRILAYADDIAIFCTDSESIEKAIEITKTFCSRTGCSVNWSKCSGFWHGRWASKPTFLAHIAWSTLPTRYLGVPLEYYKDSAGLWSEETDKLREKAAPSAGRHLSIFARATVCNSFFCR